MSLQIFQQADVRIERDQRVGRRHFLKTVTTASVAAGALSWSDRLALGAAEMRQRGTACILLWMAGGPSQFETFSPLVGHANGGETKAISTKVSGIEIAENLPMTAGVMDELAIIRSMTSKEGNHRRASFLLHTGHLPTPTVRYPAFGSIAAHQINNAASQLPAYVRIGRSGGSKTGGGLLGVKYDPFLHANPVKVPENTRLTTSEDRYRRRLSLLDQLQSNFESDGGQQEVRDHRALYDQAARMILSPEMKAFDLDSEPEKIRQEYGEGDFAAGCLLARRLVESGVTFVEVVSRGWDTHQDNFTRSRTLAAEIDRPMAQLIQDLKRRGMLEKTLVVWMGEFGRTPQINGRAGRDHFPRAFTVALAGAGVRGGQVIGRVDSKGMRVVDRSVTTPDLFQSFCKLLSIDPDHENFSSAGRPIKIVDGGQPVKELFS